MTDTGSGNVHAVLLGLAPAEVVLIARFVHLFGDGASGVCPLLPRQDREVVICQEPTGVALRAAPPQRVKRWKLPSPRPATHPNAVPKMMTYSDTLACSTVMLPIAPPALLNSHSSSSYLPGATWPG